jgi:hypothetical protein
MTTQKIDKPSALEIVRETGWWVAQLGPVFLVLLAGWHAYHAVPDGVLHVRSAFLAVFLMLGAIFFLIALPEDEQR